MLEIITVLVKFLVIIGFTGVLVFISQRPEENATLKIALGGCIVLLVLSIL
ncbi:hypothetical protein [Hymenobacter metallicola]|uniref:hypothetical protein n=1 Tax=Hymenobacter metallicola TaxID=2563114 RepID=UPI0014367339|nr:hypothetical protein [Hymenobacter metallicola]